VITELRRTIKRSSSGEVIDLQPIARRN